VRFWNDAILERCPNDYALTPCSLPLSSLHARARPSPQADEHEHLPVASLWAYPPSNRCHYRLRMDGWILQSTAPDRVHETMN
jgi:hypothetical protein